MQSRESDFEEVPIKPGPAVAGPGHNNPPPDEPPGLKVPTPEQVAAHLVESTKTIDARLATFEEKLKLTPETIEDAVTAQKVVDFITIVEAGGKVIEDAFTKDKNPWLHGGRVVDQHYNARRARREAVVTALKARGQAYRRKLQAAEDARLRAEAEAKRAAEAERLRLEAEQRDREAKAAREAAEKAAEQGRLDEAIKTADEAAKKEAAAAEQAAAAKAVEAAPIQVAPAAPAPKLQGTLGGSLGSGPKRWTAEVIDKAKLPLEYLEPDMALVKAKMQAEVKAGRLKPGDVNETIIPGVKMHQVAKD